LQLRTGSPTGPVVSSVAVPLTGSWDAFTNVTGRVTGVPATTGPLYLTFSDGLGYLFDLDAFTLNSADAHIGPIVGLANKCLDVEYAGTGDGTKIQLFTCNNTAAQTWTVTAGSTVKALGKCLDVAGGATANGTKVQLWTCNGSAAQTWAADADGSLRNPRSGRCLDVSQNNPSDGQQIHIWDCVGAASQKWVLP
jgi:hypothetical protein